MALLTIPTSIQHHHLHLLIFFLQSSPPHRDLHSFPTRRSSDLRQTLQHRQAFAVFDGRSRERLRGGCGGDRDRDRKSTRLNSSHVAISYAVFCLKKKNKKTTCVSHPLPNSHVCISPPILHLSSQ